MDRGVQDHSSVGDEVLRWRVVDPGDTVEGFGGPLFNAACTYPVVVVPADKPQHREHAIEEGVIGRIGNGERTELTVTLRSLRPMMSFHLGYQEGPYWHWTTLTMPIKLRPMECTDRSISVQVDFSQLESIVAIRTLVVSPSNNGAYRMEREHLVNDLNIDEESNLQIITFRSLMSCCAFFIQAWPIFADGSQGQGSLRLRVVTQAEVVLFFQEVGDTYLRIGFRRPPLRPPLHTDVHEADAHVEEYSLRVWEDPTESLVRNATRLSKGRQPQRYPLRKSEYRGKCLPCGVTQLIVVENLKPNTAHFITLHTRGPVAEAWDPRLLRVRVKTCVELCLPLSAPQLTSTSLSLSWHRDQPSSLSFCDLDVSFPSQVNLFNDREVTNPYVGSRVVELPEGQVWSPPTILERNQDVPTRNVTRTSSSPRTAGATLQSEHDDNMSYEVCITDTAHNTSRIIRTDNPSVVAQHLTPSTLYIIKVRTIPIPIQHVRGDAPTPWSRPYVFMTPSVVLCREIHRTRTSVTFAWGRHLPTMFMPLDYAPGRFKYLPDVNATEPNYPYYYYLEPLPYLCGEDVEKAVLSDSEDEEEVYADGCITGSGIGYLGKRSRIFNRAPRPEPFPEPCRLDREEFFNVELVLFKESSASGMAAQKDSSSSELETGNNKVVASRGDDNNDWSVRDDDAAVPEGASSASTPAPGDALPTLSMQIPSVPDSSKDNSFHGHPAREAELSQLRANTYGESNIAQMLRDMVVLVKPMKKKEIVQQQQQTDLVADRLLTSSTTTEGKSVTLGEAPDEEPLTTLMWHARVSFSSDHGTFTFDNLPADQKMRLFFFYSSSQHPYPRLAHEVDLFTLPAETSGCPVPSSMMSTRPAQSMWSTFLCDSNINEDRRATLELGEVSEVFVTLNVGRTASKECKTSLQLSMLEQNALEFQPDEETQVDDEEEEVKDDESAGNPMEFLLRVEQVEVIDGVRAVIGDPRTVYLCTTEENIQLVDLTAASRYEVSAATMSLVHHTWTPFSEPISFTTVQKLLFELEEISTEYIKLKWGRSRLDRIQEYSLHITDITAGAMFNASSVRAADSGTFGKSLLTTATMTPALTNSAQYLKNFSDKQVITLQGTHYRIDTKSDLRSNALFDCMVVPHYVNGQRGLFSNVLRFLHCSLLGRVVEVGVAHLRLEWEPPAIQALVPKCEAGAASNDTIVTVCLIRLRNASRTWERTVQCDPYSGSFTFDGLSPQTQYDAHVTLIALLPRCNCCVPPDPTAVIQCMEPFALSGETLGQPSARVTKVWEDAVEISWLFEAEPQHVGDVELELRFSDRKHAESMTTLLRAEANGKHGQGEHVVRGLSAGRVYTAQLRQKYSRGTWGEWRDVLHCIKTLPKLQISILSISETAFRVRAFREPLDVSTIVGMEDAIKMQTMRYRYRVELLRGDSHAARQQSLSSPLSASTAASGAFSETLNQTVAEDGVPDAISSGDPLSQTLDDTTGRFVETLSVDSFLDKCESNTPYRITAQQWSLDDWGASSQALHAYTLNNMVPGITRRCDSYFEIHCARDKRLPPISTTLCTPHNESSTLQHSRLIGVTLTATSLITNIMTTRFFLPCTEATCSALVGRVADLEAAHPYRVDVRTEYEQDEVCPLVMSLATITVPIPNITVAGLGEDFASLNIDRKSAVPAMAQALDTFHNLPPSVRHAANEGLVVDVLEYQFCFSPIFFDDVEEHERPVVFQSGSTESETTSVPSSNTAVSKFGLMAEIPYNILLCTVDERGFQGRKHLIGAVYTRALPKLYVNKLSENFAEIEWREEEDEIGEDHTVSTVSGAISKRFGRWTRIPSGEGYNVNRNGNIHDNYEFIIAEDIEVPDITRPATRTAVVEYKKKCSLVEQLNPETQYFVIGRCRRVIPDGTGGTLTIPSAWGAPTRFATLALLVLRVIHCSLDFANIAWQDPVTAKPVTRTSPMHGPGNLPDMLCDSTTSFTKEAVKAMVSEDGFHASAGSAQAVRFQLRLMHATNEGQCGPVIEDMYVVTTDDGIHTIEHLVPGKSYAVSMRVCYEGLSGSWVAPAVFRTDHFPEPRYLSITRRDVDMEIELDMGGELREGDAFKVPDRNHRLYEYMVGDSDLVRFLILKVHNTCGIFIGGLVRGRKYVVAIREVINGVRYGQFVHLCAFWIQPYPPIITRLLECRDGVCEMEWTVIERKTQKERDEEEDVGFVYQLQQGSRVKRSPTALSSSRGGNGPVVEGENWVEVVTTDVVNHRFKWTERVQNPQSAVFSDLCFRVRTSKCFVLQDGLAYKTPVWGDWSMVAFWDEAQPPAAVEHLGIAYCSDTCAIAKWDLPTDWEVHPNLKFCVRLRLAELPPNGDPKEAGALVAPTEVEANGVEWFTIGTTPYCAIELPNLAKATMYVVAVQSESSFGINPQKTAISFTSRYSPNDIAKPPIASIAPRPLISAARMKALLLPGLRPVDPFHEQVSNLYDKYEEPKKLRLRAVIRMAGMLDRTQRGLEVQQRFQRFIRRLITAQKIIYRFAVDTMLSSRFQPNEVYSPTQVARLRFGLDPESHIIVWTRELEEFLATAEHTALRRVFSMSPSALALHDAPKARSVKRLSPIRKKRLLPTPTGNSSAQHPARVATAEGVSWTTERDTVARRSPAGRPLDRLNQVRSAPSGGKFLLEGLPSKKAADGKGEASTTTSKKKAVPSVTTGAHTSESASATPNINNDELTTPRDVLSSPVGSVHGLPKPHRSPNSVRLPTLAAPVVSPSHQASVLDRKSLSLSERMSSVSEETMKQVASLQAPVDPPPAFPMMLRRQLLGRGV